MRVTKKATYSVELDWQEYALICIAVDCFDVALRVDADKMRGVKNALCPELWRNK